MKCHYCDTKLDESLSRYTPMEDLPDPLVHTGERCRDVLKAREHSRQERIDALQTSLLAECENVVAAQTKLFTKITRVSELERTLESVTQNLEEHIAAGTVLCDDCNDSVMAARVALRKPEDCLADDNRFESCPVHRRRKPKDEPCVFCEAGVKVKP